MKQSPERHASPPGSALESLGQAPAAAAFLIKDADPLPFGEGPTSTSGFKYRREGTRILAAARPAESDGLEISIPRRLHEALTLDEDGHSIYQKACEFKPQKAT